MLRRRVKTQAALPTEGAVLRVFFGLWVSGQMKLRRIKGYRDIGGKEKDPCSKKEFHDFSEKMRHSLFYRIRDRTSNGHRF